MPNISATPPDIATDRPAYLDRALYISVDDRILLQAISNVASQVITINARLLLDDGRLVPIEVTAQTGSAVTLLTTAVQLAQGWLVGFEISCPAAATAGQWLYAKLGLTRGGGTIPASYHPLFAGYTGSSFGFGYPNQQLQRPTDGAGALRSIITASPGAGNPFTITVPAKTRWRILHGILLLNTSTAVGDRNVDVKVQDASGNTVWKSPSVQTQAPNIGVTYNLGPGLSGEVDTALFQPILPFPDKVVLGPGWTLTPDVTNFDTGDNWATLNLTVLEWCELL